MSLNLSSTRGRGNHDPSSRSRNRKGEINDTRASTLAFHAIAALGSLFLVPGDAFVNRFGPCRADQLQRSCLDRQRPHGQRRLTDRLVSSTRRARASSRPAAPRSTRRTPLPTPCSGLGAHARAASSIRQGRRRHWRGALRWGPRHPAAAARPLTRARGRGPKTCFLNQGKERRRHGGQLRWGPRHAAAAARRLTCARGSGPQDLLPQSGKGVDGTEGARCAGAQDTQRQQYDSDPCSGSGPQDLLPQSGQGRRRHRRSATALRATAPAIPSGNKGSEWQHRRQRTTGNGTTPTGGGTGTGGNTNANNGNGNGGNDRILASAAVRSRSTLGRVRTWSARRRPDCGRRRGRRTDSTCWAPAARFPRGTELPNQGLSADWRGHVPRPVQP